MAKLGGFSIVLLLVSILFITSSTPPIPNAPRRVRFRPLPTANMDGRSFSANDCTSRTIATTASNVGLHDTTTYLDQRVRGITARKKLRPRSAEKSLKLVMEALLRSGVMASRRDHS